MGSGADLMFPQLSANLLSEVPFSSCLSGKSTQMSIECGFGVRASVCMCLVIRAVIRVVNLELSSCETLPSGHSVESKIGIWHR